MNRELIEEILKDISTPTGISYSGDKTIANSTVENILEFIDDLQKKAELGEHYKHLYSEVKKQKDDVVELIKKETKEFHFENDKLIDILRMLGEIDVED
jgi:hypothetical protein